MPNTNPVVTQFTGDARPFFAELNKVKGELSGFRRDVANIASSVGNIVKGYLGYEAILHTVRSVIEATTEQQNATAQLNAALASARAPVQAASTAFQQYAAQLQSVTTFSANTVEQVQAILLSFKGLSGETIKDATKSVLDLSARMGIDASSAAKLLGKALSDPVGGIGALSRAGVVFSEQQQEQIKILSTSGESLKAQDIIVNQLKDSFGGAAEAARDTFGGAITGLKGAFEDLLTGKGGINAAADSINHLTDVLSSPEIKTAFSELISSLATVISLAAQAASGLAILFTGKGGNQVVDIDLQIEKLQKERDALATVINAGGTKEDVIGGSGGLEVYSQAQLQGDQKRIAAIDAQLRDLKVLEDQLLGLGDQGPGGALQAVTVTAKKVGNNPLDFITGGKAADSFAAFQKEVDDFVAQLATAQDAAVADLDQISQASIDADQKRVADEEDLRQRSIAAEIEYQQQRVGAENEANAIILQQREGVINATVGLLQFLAQKSKGAAIALIALEKARSIAQIIQNAAVAKLNIMATSPVYAWPAAIAGVEAMEALQIGIVAATGVLQAASVGSGGGGPAVAPGAPNNPIYTQSGGNGSPAPGVAAGASIIVNVQGYISQSVIDDMVEQLGQFVNERDGIIINANSRQAQELQSG